ncbi:MAG: hypothetical protein GY854_22430 [Deltaproteobacteria bacterium]|nr:hypothetical protein [Deltaproteobacteria bacterium]
MVHKKAIVSVVFIVLVAVWMTACGSSQPPPPNQDTGEEDFDLVGSIVGDVEPEEIDEEGDEVGEGYTGPTSLTVNLKIVNDKNPEGTFKLTAADGSVITENGKVGEVTELNQGVYSIEFKSPVVFGEATHVVEDVQVAGKKMTVSEVFPAGQITLHTYRGKKPDKCVPTSFSVKSKAEDGKMLPGKGKTCEPLVLRAGAYEVLLDISKKKVQPVEMLLNSEEVRSAQVKLEK